MVSHEASSCASCSSCSKQASRQHGACSHRAQPPSLPSYPPQPNPPIYQRHPLAALPAPGAEAPAPPPPLVQPPPCERRPNRPTHLLVLQLLHRCRVPAARRPHRLSQRDRPVARPIVELLQLRRYLLHPARANKGGGRSQRKGPARGRGAGSAERRLGCQHAIAAAIPAAPVSALQTFQPRLSLSVLTSARSAAASASGTVPTAPSPGSGSISDGASAPPASSPPPSLPPLP